MFFKDKNTDRFIIQDFIYAIEFIQDNIINAKNEEDRAIWIDEFKIENDLLGEYLNLIDRHWQIDLIWHT